MSRTIEPLDFSALLEMLGGKQEIVVTLLGTFLDELAADVDASRQAAVAEDTAMLRQIAHRDPHGGNHRPCRKIVAVVGAGHCSGMEDFLSVPWAPGDVASILAEMNEVPDPRDWERSRRVIAWSVGLTLAGSVLGTVYAASMVASRLRRR